LNLYEGSKFGIVPDGTPVQVDKLGEFYISPQLHIIGDEHMFIFHR
jgi:hypothetical protein